MARRHGPCFLLFGLIVLLFVILIVLLIVILIVILIVLLCVLLFSIIIVVAAGLRRMLVCTVANIIMHADTACRYLR
jgi:hypothetical protein